MAISATRVTRLGKSGYMVAPYGDFSGKTLTEEPTTQQPEARVPFSTGGGGKSPIAYGVDWDKRREIADTIRELYQEVREEVSEPGADEDLKDKVADTVAPYAPPSAPDIPPGRQIDWEGIAEDERSLRAVYAALTSVQIQLVKYREARIMEDDDEAALLLLME